MNNRKNSKQRKTTEEKSTHSRRIDFDIKPPFWPSIKYLKTSSILKRYEDKKEAPTQPDDFGKTLRGTQLDGYFNRTSKASEISLYFFKEYKPESSGLYSELESCASTFYKLLGK